MKTDTQSIKVVRTINAAPQEVFDSFQYECRLREWMCDGTRTAPLKGGLFEVCWNSGYEARGVFTAYSPPRALAFTWGSAMEPGETQRQRHTQAGRGRNQGHADSFRFRHRQEMGRARGRIRARMERRAG